VGRSVPLVVAGMLVYIRGICQSCCTSNEVDDFGAVDPTGVAGPPEVFVQLSLQAALPVVVLVLVVRQLDPGCVNDLGDRFLDPLRLGLLPLSRLGFGLGLSPLRLLVVLLLYWVVQLSFALGAYTQLTSCQRQWIETDRPAMSGQSSLRSNSATASLGGMLTRPVYTSLKRRMRFSFLVYVACARPNMALVHP
jgi:hypothetical protein